MTMDFKDTTARTSALLDGVRDEQLVAKTPCPDYNVAALLDHFMGLTLAFTWVARKETDKLTDDPPYASAEDLDPQWRVLLPRRLEELATAWNDPAAWEGQIKAVGVDMPTSVWGMVALNELMVHGWDLARATGQGYTAESAALANGEQLMASDEDRGDFGPIVPVPPGSSELDRVIGLSGRNPAWLP